MKDLSFRAEEGEVICVIGKNGSGKTTLTRILATLVEPDAGRAIVCGYDVVSQARDVRKNIGVMLNAGDGGFQPRISGVGNLGFYAALYQVPRRLAKHRIRDLLHDLGLEDRGADQYQSYSSGMRRRLALARTLLSDPAILLLDEPTLGVDPWSTVEIHKKLQQIATDGKTILCTTNNMSEANALGHRILGLENGLLKESRPKEMNRA